MSASNETPERREIIFSGRVQGVGFRYTTRAIAARFDVCGFVENLHDGRVLLVVEGKSDTLDRFTRAIQAEMERYIAAAQTRALPATGEFARFEVRR